MSISGIVARIALGIAVPVVAFIVFFMFLPEGETSDDDVKTSVLVMILAELLYLAIILW